MVLGFFAAASCALGVADVVLTYQNYMVSKGCNNPPNPSPAMCNPNNLVWTWVGVGIWASIPVFLLAISAIRSASHHDQRQHGCLEFKAAISLFIFTPAMVILSAIEAYKGAGIYYWTAQPPLTTDDQAKAAIPITIACLGFVEHIMAAIAFWAACCCFNTGTATTTANYGVMEQAYAPAPLPAPAPVVMRSSCNTCPQTNFQPSYAPRAQMYPSSGCGPCGQGTKFSGAVYGGNAGFGGRPWSGVNNYSGVNNFSNMRSSVLNSGGVYSSNALPANSAYNFYSR
jgi:hypothetical protein